MLKIKILSGALQGGEIRDDALRDLETMASSVAAAVVQEVHAVATQRGGAGSPVVLTEADVETATLHLFGEQLGASLVQHALNVRHRG